MRARVALEERACCRDDPRTGVLVATVEDAGCERPEGLDVVKFGKPLT